MIDQDGDDLDIDDMLADHQLATDPRLCAWCGQPYEVVPMLGAALRLADGGSWQTFGEGMTFSRCDKDGVFVMS